MLGKRPRERVEEATAAPPTDHKAPISSIQGERPALVASTSTDAEEGSDPPKTSEHSRWYLPVGIGGFRVRALHDSGASRTAVGPIGLQIATACGKQITPHRGIGARLANGRTVSVMGQVDLPFDVAGVRHYLNVVILEELDADCLLGADFMRKFNAILRPRESTLSIDGVAEPISLELAALAHDEASAIHLASVGLADVDDVQRQQVQELLDQLLPTNDQPLGCTSRAEHNIEVVSSRPIKQKYYPVSKKLEEEMHRQVHEMLKAGIIVRSISEWSSPVVMQRKANRTYRFCIDYRKLNAITKASAYPLPHMDAILRKLQDARYISTIDLSSAYHQIPLRKEAQALTAFTVPGLGLFEFTRMPYGVVGGPATFQELSDRIIGPEMEPHAFSYLDDIIIVTETFEEHLKWLAHVLQRIKDAGLTINREKSEFCRSEVKFLGVLVNRDGFKPDPDKIAPILEYPAPKNLKQLRRFLGMASWYRKFLPDFATIAESLTRLTKQSVAYEWGETEQSAFEQIKALIASAPVLHRPSFNHQFVIQTDASDTGLGAVLTQTIDGEERVLCFASRTMTAAERNYSVTERECLAVLWAIRKFRAYVEGYHFKVITDHSSLKWLCNLHNPTGRLARWALEMQAYDYDVEHRKGSMNHVPDALSRMFEDEEVPELAAIDAIEETSDAWYKRIFEAVNQDPTEHPQWKVVRGRLYTYRPNPMLEDLMEDEDSWKLVLPMEKREGALLESHSEPTAGHLGRAKTLARLSLYYYWPSMRKEAANFVRNCLTCQQCKVQQAAPAGLMGSRRAARPWQIVAGDIMGPLPRSPRGHEYLLIFLDLFTRWIECVPIRRANAQTICKELNERVFLRFGPPEVFHSDNGTEFKNKALDKFLEERGVSHTTIPPYHAQANPVERVNRTIKTMITSFLEDNHRDWDSYVPELMYAYNTAVQESTGSSPAFLNLGRQPAPPVSLKRSEERAAEDFAEAAEVERWRSRLRRLSEVQQIAADNSTAAQQRQARYYNASRRDVKFDLGEKVLKRNRILSSASQGVAAKLAPKFTGPYTISAQIGSNVYELKDSDGRPIGKVHVEDLKPFHEDPHTLGPEGEGVPTSSQASGETLRATANQDVADGPPKGGVFPRKRGRPRKTRVVVKRTAHVVGRPTSQRPQDAIVADERLTQPSNRDPSTPPRRRRGRPVGSTKTADAQPIPSTSPRRTRARARETKE